MALPVSAASVRRAQSADSSLSGRLMAQFGDAPALLAGSGRRAPDRRRVSLRWLFGSILVGTTSVLLMGGALYAALDGRQQLADPAAAMSGPVAQFEGGATQGDRLHSAIALRARAEKVMEVPTLTREGDGQVIRKRPFAYAAAPLAVLASDTPDYPRFDPLTVFRASGDDALSASSDAIYGADIESQVRVRTEDFPVDSDLAQFDTSGRISDAQAEQSVRNAKPGLTDGAVEVAALPYLDDTRFSLAQNAIDAATSSASGPDVSIVASNVSTVLPAAISRSTDRDFREDIVAVPAGQRILAVLDGMELTGDRLPDMKTALAGELGDTPRKREATLRVAYEVKNGERIARRISVYRNGTHLASIATRDAGQIVWANTPVEIPAIAARDDEADDPTPLVASGEMPSIYDGLYRAALSQGLSTDNARRIVRTVAFDVDFRSRVRPDDALEVFHSLPDERQEGTEILHIALTVGGTRRNYYRFTSRASGEPVVDFYDEEGRSAKKFLLRKPVPNGKFGSPFGPRRHPISRRVKMHNGVDFSAPRGTPIVAAGSGVVEEAKWAGGYGRRTILRHANGYKTSYSHQTRFARGIKAGARVRQGQIIGYVGSTGYSTGPHLHYEVMVNGNRVNPMKIRLPRGQVLKGAELAAFKRERERIDALMERGRNGAQVASL